MHALPHQEDAIEPSLLPWLPHQGHPSHITLAPLTKSYSSYYPELWHLVSFHLISSHWTASHLIATVLFSSCLTLLLRHHSVELLLQRVEGLRAMVLKAGVVQPPQGRRGQREEVGGMGEGRGGREGWG